MNFWLALTALVVALILTALFAFGSGRISSWRSRWIFLIVLFLTTWAVSLWVVPAGPSVSGVYWVQAFVIGFILAVLILASIPPRPSFTTKANPKPYTEVNHPKLVNEKDKDYQVGARETEHAYNLFFWLLIVILIGVIFLGYLS